MVVLTDFAMIMTMHWNAGGDSDNVICDINPLNSKGWKTGQSFKAHNLETGQQQSYRIQM